MHYSSLQEALTSGRGRERQFLCHVHGDSNPSASVNASTGAWICYACHASGWVDLNGIDLDPYAVRRHLDDLSRRIEQSHPRYPDGWLNFFDATGPGDYWLSRYSEEVCRSHRLGKTPDGKHATIPLHDNSGAITGVIMRSLTGESPKYKYPNNAKLSERLYGYHRADKEILFLVEGATDVVAVDEVSPGYAMALYGSRMSRAQAKLLYRYSPKVILVATDQDQAGEKAYQSVKTHMGSFCTTLRLSWDTYKDVSAIPLEERRDLLEWAISEYDLPSLARVG